MKSLENLPSRAAIEAELERRERNRITRFYPDMGPLRRELYRKHLTFFRAGKEHRERLMLAGNRTGKSTVGAYEVTCHLTGQYPHWWEGRRFDHPVRVWAAGDTSKTVREIIQEKMLGPVGKFGTGMIPGDALAYTVPKHGVPEAVEIVYVRHVGGDNSPLLFKSYDQRREAFQGTEQDVIWLDEEPPMDIYTECLLRTMTSNGLVLLTFTPLQGLTELVLAFLPGGKLPTERG